LKAQISTGDHFIFHLAIKCLHVTSLIKLINFCVAKGTSYRIGTYRLLALSSTRKLRYALPLKEWFAPVVRIITQEEGCE
jgi:hypothetical protein